MAEPLDWRATLMAEVAAIPESGGSKADVVGAVEIDFLMGAYGAVLQAAAARRISVPAFTRRSAYAMAAHDLNIPLADLIAIDARMTRDSGIPFPDPEMRRFGAWEIEALKVVSR